MRVLAESAESDDDTSVFFFGFFLNDWYRRKPGDVALTFGKVISEMVRFACARRRLTLSPLTPLGPGTPASPLKPWSRAIKWLTQSGFTKEKFMPVLAGCLAGHGNSRLSQEHQVCQEVHPSRPPPDQSTEVFRESTVTIYAPAG